MSRPNSQRPLTYYAWLSIIAAILTLGLKTAAWKMTGSVGLLSDALESIVNVIASFIALATVWVSARPADEDHAYGHTKVEYFASGFEGGLILIAAIGIGVSAVDRILHVHPLEDLGIGLVLSVFATILNFLTAALRGSGSGRQTFNDRCLDFNRGYFGDGTRSRQRLALA